MSRIISMFLASLLVVLVAACGQGKSKEDTLRIGTIAGPETSLMEVAQKVALSRYGLKIRIVAFSDYLQPDAALADGSIDANLFQHQAFLNQQVEAHHYSLVAIGKAFIYPMGFYPGKTRSIQALPDGAQIAIPNDPSNEGRALVLLDKMGLIVLKNQAGFFATPADIIQNPHHIKLKELDAAQLARSLPDVDGAVINTNYAVEAGLSPAKDALYLEDANSPFANIIVVRTDEVNDPRMQQLLSAYQSKEVEQAAEDIFHGDAIPAWKKAEKKGKGS